jgi:hypothetical protein
MLKFFSGAQNSVFNEQQKVVSLNLAAGDLFSSNAVAVSADGNTAIIGAPFHDNVYLQSGAAYIFTRTSSFWSQQEQLPLTTADLAAGSEFGRAVAISADGNTVVVGARFNSADDGAAYVFVRSGSSWSKQQQLIATSPQSRSGFGSTVAISADSNTILVGAPGYDSPSFSGNGAAYVFTKSGTTWSEQQVLTAALPKSSASFGGSVALSANGNLAFIGAPFERDTTFDFYFIGSAFVFTRSGATWSEQQKITPSDPNTNADMFFGSTVSTSYAGNILLVSAPYKLPGGAAYVFTQSGSTWAEQQKLIPTSTAIVSGDLYGGCSVSADGNTVLVGAPGSDGAMGVAYIFTNFNSAWSEQQKILPSVRLSNDFFGSVYNQSLSGNAATAICGVAGNPPGSSTGAAYVFAS